MNQELYHRLVAVMAQFQERPKVADAAKAAGLDKVTAAERDAAWDAHQQQVDEAAKADEQQANPPDDPASAPADQGEDIEGIWVRTVPGVRRFRRAGMAFNDAGTGIALEALTDEQLAALEAEPNLIVERNTFSDQPGQQG